MTTGPNWGAAGAACIEHLRALIRIPSVNPPGTTDSGAGRETIGGETAAASYCAEVLTSAGIQAEVLETSPGRGSCFARLPATVKHPLPPLILLSHVDVVPVEAAAWTRDPFGGELIDGVVWGRGAVDMKGMVAMELSVMEALHRSDGERLRDVIFAACADEEAGGEFGARHWVEKRPDLFCATDGRPAAAALNEIGGYSTTIGGRRVYAIQVAEKGIVWTRLGTTGTPGHASMPHPDNAATKLAEAVANLAAFERPIRLTPIVRGYLAALGLASVAAQLDDDDVAGAMHSLGAAVDDPVLRRSLRSMLRDTVTPTTLRAGTKVNVIAGTGEAELDVRTLPGTDQATLLAELQERVGNLASVEAVVALPAVEAPADARIVALMHEALAAADPEATAAPMMITPGTDAKALSKLAIPTYGFAPLRLDAEMPFLSLFHGHDERVPVSALQFGLPVLHEVCRRFVGEEEISAT